MNPENNNENEDKTCYNGVCMEIAGIESCDLGYSAPIIPNPEEES